MKKLILASIVLSVYALNVQSQNDPNKGNPQSGDKKACLKISSLSVSTGVNDFSLIGKDGRSFNGSPNDQNGLQPGNVKPMMDHRNGNFASGRQLNFEIGFNPYSKKLGDYNKKREITLGLYYSGANLADRNSMKFSIVPGDTFSHNSTTYQNDTIKRTHKSYREEANIIGISFQSLYKTDPDKKLSLFTGYGINLGYAVTARIYKRTSKDSAVVVNYYNTQTNYNEFNNGTLLGSEVLKTSSDAKPTILTSVFIPIGINFRICKTKEIWNQMNLFAQADFGLQAETVINRRAHFNPYVGYSMGFKFNLK